MAKSRPRGPLPDLTGKVGLPVADVIADLRARGLEVRTRYVAFSGPFAMLAALAPTPAPAPGRALTALVAGGKVMGFADDGAPGRLLAAAASAVLRFAGSGPGAGVPAQEAPDAGR
jgi:hypothetical protein